MHSVNRKYKMPLLTIKRKSRKSFYQSHRPTRDYRNVKIEIVFFCASGENHQNDEFRPQWKKWAKDSVRLLRTKNPACALQLPLVPGPRYRNSFERFPRPWQKYRNSSRFPRDLESPVQCRKLAVSYCISQSVDTHMYVYVALLL